MLLSERVGALTGPDTILDQEVAIVALGWQRFQTWKNDKFPDAGWVMRGVDLDGCRWEMSAGMTPRFTASLDAAMTLVDLLYWMIRNESGGPVATIMDTSGNEYEAKCATPALALTAAALRSRGL